ncbi:hypothetical protein [Bacteroides sp. 224]|uniref:hypothetical protein n=1 Tax=Bacteroides sp. 224 TaxID=2302936 RepID=UPI0013D49FC3|nr:hypothetical protein [Bacteroides sp. 224]NDV66941.1 hypothetical protein [Bacteroides sp. 224]
MDSDGKLFFEKPVNHRLNLSDYLIMESVMEDLIRTIIQTMIKEPLVKSVIEDELNKALLPGNISLSSIRIDKDCNIFLGDYDNAKVEIKGYQAQTLYIFYLLSPVGVSNRDLPVHKDTLKKIYREVCGGKLNDVYRSESVIDGLLNRPGGITDATNKIRVALKKAIPAKEMLNYYMICGNRNCTRQISIPKHLIKVENEQLTKIGKWRSK